MIDPKHSRSLPLALVFAAVALTACQFKKVETDGAGHARGSTPAFVPSPGAGELKPALNPRDLVIDEADAISLPHGGAQVFAMGASYDPSTRLISHSLQARTIVPKLEGGFTSTSWVQAPLPGFCAQPRTGTSRCALTAVWQADSGKIFVIGRQGGEPGDEGVRWFVQRLLKDLTLDVEFGGGDGLIEGKVYGDRGHAYSTAHATIQPGFGSYLMTTSLGSRGGPTTNVVAWIGPNGELDPEFGHGDPQLPESERSPGTLVFSSEPCQAITQATYDSRTRDVFLALGHGKRHPRECASASRFTDVRILKLDRHGELSPQFSAVALKVHAIEGLPSVSNLRLLSWGALVVTRSSWDIHQCPTCEWRDEEPGRTPYVWLDPVTGNVHGETDVSVALGRSYYYKFGEDLHVEAVFPHNSGRIVVLRNRWYSHLEGRLPEFRKATRTVVHLDPWGRLVPTVPLRSMEIADPTPQVPTRFFKNWDGKVWNLSWTRGEDGDFRFEYFQL